MQINFNNSPNYQLHRITDESRYPFEQLVDPVAKPRGFGVFFIQSTQI